MHELSRSGSPEGAERPLRASPNTRQPFAVRPAVIHPRFREMDPPVIILGMHRSGTSMVAAMLGALGVYIGPEFAGRTGSHPGEPPEASRLNGYAEAADFFRLNELLLRGARATWARVDPFLRRRDRPSYRIVAQAALQKATFGSLSSGFLGPVPATYRGPWGWKDPRNSLTLPVWLRLFPQARVIHVRRHPDAVVASLHRRALRWAQSDPAPAPATTPVGRLKSGARRIGLLPPLLPDPCLDPEYCRRLCALYVAECNRAMELSHSYLEIHYEDALADPESAVRELARIAACTPSREQFRVSAGIVHRSRAG